MRTGHVPRIHLVLKGAADNRNTGRGGGHPVVGQALAQLRVGEAAGQTGKAAGRDMLARTATGQTARHPEEVSRVQEHPLGLQQGLERVGG